MKPLHILGLSAYYHDSAACLLRDGEIVAAGGAVALALVLSERVLGVPYIVHFGLPLAGIVAGTLGVAIAGLIGTRRAVSSPPLQTIRAVT
jgi:putative ABC transport system permease protein